MGLFSTLASPASKTGSKARTSTLDIPNVIQLFKGSPILVEKNAKNRKFSVLSYQTVNVNSSAAYEGGALLSKQEQEATSLHPNLGIWNCRISKAGKDANGETSPALADDILKAVPTSDAPPTICMSIDISNLAEVEPTISLLQDALVRYLISSGTTSTTKISETATTSLYDLRSTNFGLAVNDEAGAKSMTSTPPEESDRKLLISLVLSVVLPSRPQEEAAQDGSSAGYKEKQAEALVLYHLRKYAAKLNAVLCFVRKDRPSKVEPQAIATLTLNQLAFVWHQLAEGLDGWKELVDSWDKSADGGEETTPSSAVSGIFGPGHHHEDLIEAVLLRNAQFPGQWDAAKDSLWVALPAPEDETNDENRELVSNQVGDEFWLSELRASVASEAKTPPPKDKSANVASTTKTPNDAAVSSFFESLLKP